MIAVAYFLAFAGFSDAGWPFWHALWWPYYLAKHVAGVAS